MNLRSRTRTDRRWLASLATALLAGCIGPEPAQCQRAPTPMTCGDCIARAGCGWCATPDGRTSCVQGGALGPSEHGVCEDGAWSFVSCSSAAPLPPTLPCERHTDCSSCAGANGCGWCIATATCMRGSFTGPYGASCPGTFAATAETCGVLCSVERSCDACLGVTNCVWCIQTRNGAGTCRAERCTSAESSTYTSDECTPRN